MTNTPKTTRRGFGLRSTAAALGVVASVVSLSIVNAGATPVSHSTPVVQLELYSAQGYDSYVVNAFNASHSTIHVTLNDNSTGTLLTQIAAEQASGHPVWNMMWADGATWAAQFDKAGWSVKNILPSGVNFNSAGIANLPYDRSFVPTGVTVTGGLCSDTVATNGSTPSTFAQLVNMPRGALGMNNPSLSGPTFPLIAGEMAHLEGLPSSTTANIAPGSVAKAIAKGKAFLLALKANGLQVHNTNGPTLGAMESNPATLKAATIQTSACYGDIAAGYWPTGAVTYLDYSVALPSTIAVSTNVSKAQLAAAKTFVGYVLSVKGQQAMQDGDPQGDGLFWPVITGVNPEAGLPAYSSTKAYAINPYVWGPLQSSIDAWFTANVIN
jgi:iron(III) transport system substrate-binding protein